MPPNVSKNMVDAKRSRYMAQKYLNPRAIRKSQVPLMCEALALTTASSLPFFFSGNNKPTSWKGWCVMGTMRSSAFEVLDSSE